MPGTSPMPATSRVPNCPSGSASCATSHHWGDLQQRIPLVGGGRLLAHHGHAGVVNVIGGMTAWTNAGYPIEQ
jgi:hypothetical protein